MTKPILHFAHANGVPSACYQKMLAILAENFEVVMIPVIGIDPNYPIDNHWHSLTQQVADSIERQNQGRPVYVLGHSLGALTSYMVAHRFPHLVKALVMLDPPLINGIAAYSLHIAKLLGKADNMTPAAKSKNRREVWPSRAEAAASLRPKGLFKTFDEQCFADYISYGLKDCAEGVCLTVPVANEVAIFRNVPTNTWRYRKQLTMPAAIVVGKNSHFANTGYPERLAREQPVSLHYTQGGHMFPLEYPVETAHMVKELFDDLV
jgi:pimeloyl-ACP methyl ester carboxylesterase